MMTKYDVIVVGGGHAGCEAALATSRMGLETILITKHIDKIGFMSCNPAVGGIGKGQLVREIDALGGEMACATDASSIQYRMLNASKGAAVQSSRSQVDRIKYNAYMRDIVTAQKNLKVLEGEARKLVVKNNIISGVEIDNSCISGKTVIITPGTFLNGLIHVGLVSFDGGRVEEKWTSKEFSDSIKSLGFSFLRFKTGTCARLDGKTIDFSSLRVQNGDEKPIPLSFSTKDFRNIKQLPCFITYTNEKTHEIIRKNLNRSPLYSGKIIGRGVRYCPSLEDKVVKFPNHSRHQVFLEPEGLTTDEYYPNGISTSLPEDVQEEFIRTIPGLEKVKINRFGYGIEHDAIDPRQLYPTLETKKIKNLYFAGQVNGTTGYEEAAAQGLIAGINAALKVRGKEPLILDRSSSYIGVLIDDLVTKGTNEPYRMFTSRVEYRLLLREDNADIRLRKVGYDIGLVRKKDYEDTINKKKEIETVLKHLKETKGLEGVKLYDMLKRPGITIDGLRKSNLLSFDLSEELVRTIESEIKYAGYIKRQILEVKKFKDLEKIKIPPSLDFEKIPGLSNEIREKLDALKPISLGQASRISGVTPVAISILMVYIKK